jgi:hypothetical protein
VCWFTAAEMCLPHRCVATSAALTTEITALLLLRTFASAGMCLPIRRLLMYYTGFQASCHNMIWRYELNLLEYDLLPGFVNTGINIWYKKCGKITLRANRLSASEGPYCTEFLRVESGG